jgi:WD40 repeat protein
MASFFRGQSRSIAGLFALLPALMFAALPTAMAQLYEQPVLVVDPGMHTAQVNSIAVDSLGSIAVTGSADKTVRLWSPTDGKLLQTIRIPAGPGNIGKIYAVAMSPDGNLIAAGGWTNEGQHEQVLYFIETHTGKVVKQISGIPEVPVALTFSPDGRYLVAGLGEKGGLRAYDGRMDWGEGFRDTDYSNSIYGVTFSNDGRLAAASLDGKIRLYDRNFIRTKQAERGNGTVRISFSPDGDKLAVGYVNQSDPDILDGHSLAVLPRPFVPGSQGNLKEVIWSRDSKTLYAGGNYSDKSDNTLVFAWDKAGQGEPRAFMAGDNSVSGLTTLPDGGLLIATFDPMIALFQPDGSSPWVHQAPHANFRLQADTLAVSQDMQPALVS